MFCIELDDSDTHAAAARFNAQFDKQLIGLRELTLHLFSQTLHWWLLFGVHFQHVD